MVCLVEHGDLDVLEVGVALTDEVLEATGAGDEDVNTGLERAYLGVLGHPTEDRGGGETSGLGQRGDRLLHLGGQLARRQQHERTRMTRTRTTTRLGQAHYEREGECDGLATSRAPTTEHVATRE